MTVMVQKTVKLSVGRGKKLPSSRRAVLTAKGSAMKRGWK